MAEIIWTLRARQDLKEIVEYISQDSRAYAESFALRIRQGVMKLEAFPNSGPVLPEDPGRLTRQIVVGNYRVLYRVAGERCVILSLVHAARDLGI